MPGDEQGSTQSLMQLQPLAQSLDNGPSLLFAPAHKRYQHCRSPSAAVAIPLASPAFAHSIRTYTPLMLHTTVLNTVAEVEADTEMDDEPMIWPGS